MSLISRTCQSLTHEYNHARYQAKLLIAFGLILTTTLAASAIALYAFTRFSDAMTEINQESVPFGAEAAERIRMGMGISINLPRLTNSKTQDEASTHYEGLLTRVEEVRQLVRDVAAGQEGPTASLALNGKFNPIEQFETNITTLYQAVVLGLTEYIDVERSVKLLEGEFQSVNEALLGAIDVASSEVKTLTKSVLSQNKEAMNPQQPQHMSAMFMMSEAVEKLVKLLRLNAEFNTLVGVLGRVSQTSDITELQPLADDYLASLAQITYDMKTIGSDDKARKNANGINRITELGAVSAGISMQKREALAALKQVRNLEEMRKQQEQVYLTEMTEQVRIGRSQVDDAGNSVMSLIKSSRVKLFTVSILSILVTGLIFWLLISKDILARLLNTITALRSVADGNYDVSVNCTGGDELTGLSRTVEAFRHDALEARTLLEERALLAEKQQEQELREAERERRSREDESARHKAEQAQATLDKDTADLLQQRVDQLLAAVSTAADGNLSFPIDTLGDDLAGQMARALETLLSACTRQYAQYQ